MKAVLPRQDLQDVLQAAVSVAGGRTTKPILSCVKLDAAGEAVECHATDGEVALRLSIPALTLEQPGAAVVPAERLLSIVREMPDVEVAIAIDDRHCSIKGQGSAFRIFVQNPADFPPVPRFEDEPDLVIDGALVRRMIAQTLFAAARETSRYAINGVLWEKSGKRLFLVATDGRRLSRAGGRVRSAPAGDFRAIIPSKALSVFERVFHAARSDDDWTVDVKLLPNQALLRSGDRLLATVLVEGHFPKYEDVIPKSSNKTAHVAREELAGAVRRAALLTTEESRAVKLAFEDQRLVITSQSAEHGDARVEAAIRYEGEPIEIGFNPAFLVDALRSVSLDEVRIELSEPLRPGIVCGEDKNDFLYVIMPVSLAQ
jgi:DNA polymerase-3 subunit beta